MMARVRKPAVRLIISVLGACIATRIYLYLMPGGAGLTVFGAHVHHLLTGVVLMMIGGIPAVIITSDIRIRTVSVCVFGIGLGLALDEWVLTVVREGAPDTAYGNPLSLLGAVALVTLASGYAIGVAKIAERSRLASDRIDRQGS